MNGGTHLSYRTVTGSGVEASDTYYPPSVDPSVPPGPDPNVELAVHVHGANPNVDPSTAPDPTTDPVAGPDCTEVLVKTDGTVEVLGYVSQVEHDAAVAAATTPDDRVLPTELTKVADDGNVIRLDNGAGFWIEYRRSDQNVRDSVNGAWHGNDDTA